MGYVESSLSDGEQVRYGAKFHWLYTLGACFWLVIGALIALIALALNASWWIWSLAIGVAFWLNLMIRKWTTEIAITDRRVIYKRGWIARSTDEMGLRRIEEINLKQGVIGRLFGYGKVRIQGTGVGALILPDIDDPMTFRKQLSEAQNQMRN